MPELAEKPSVSSLIDSMMDAPDAAPEATGASPAAPEAPVQPASAPAAPAKTLDPLAPLPSFDIPPDDIISPPAPKQPATEEFPDEPHPGASEASKTAWRNLRQTYYATKDKLLALEKKPVAPQQDEAAAARIAELEQQVQQLSPIVERANIEAHPLFIKQFDEPRQRLMTEAQSVIEMADIDPAEFAGVLQSSGKARIHAIDELSETISSPTLRNRLTQIGAELERLDSERGAVIKNSKMWKEQADASMKAEGHRSAQQQKDHWSRMLDATVDAMSSQFELLRESEGNPDWNKKVAERRQGAKHALFENTDPQQVVATAVLAQLAPPYRAWALSEREGRLRAEAELAELKGSQSNLREGEGIPPVGEGGDRPLGHIFGELYRDLEQNGK